MVKIICKESGIEFEAATKRTQQHPLVAAIKQQGNENGTYREVNNALMAVRKAGGYTTIEQYMGKVRDILNGNAAKRQEESEKRAEWARKEEQQRQEAKLKRQQDNAILKAHGYTWDKEETTGYFGGVGDRPEYEWVLRDPDGHTISVRQAFDEIERGRDVVRAEIAAQQAAKVQAEKQAEQDKAESIAAFEKMHNEISATMQRVDSISFEARRDWPRIASIKNTSASRRYDGIWRGEINGVTCYVVVVRTGYDDDGYHYFYSADPAKANLKVR